MKRILIVEEHDRSIEPTYYDVSSDEQLHKVSLEIVKSLGEHEVPDKPEAPEKPDFSESDIELLPESLREEAKSRFTTWKRQRRCYENEMENYEIYRRAAEDNDGESAWEYLKVDYETYRLANVQ